MEGSWGQSTQNSQMCRVYILYKYIKVSKECVLSVYFFLYFSLKNQEGIYTLTS